MDNHDIDIRNLQFTSEDTGTFFSKTYTEYNWKFVLDGIQRSISLYHSKILGRRTIYLGKQEICRYQKYTYNFQYSFPIEVHTISIIQSDDTYLLKIDDIPFNRLLNEQKLRRFNIIRETFLEKERAKKEKKKKDKEIRKFRTFNKGTVSIPISRRNEDDKNIYKTNIYTSYRDIEDKLNSDINRNNENEINTSSNITDAININNETNRNINNEIQLNPEQYMYYYEESSDDLSNKAIDGGDSHRDEEEDEENDKDDDKTIQESFRAPPDEDIFYAENHLDENDDDEETDRIDHINDINDNIINNNDIDFKNNEKNQEEEDEKNKENNNFNNINNELLPIKQQKNEKEKEKKQIQKIKIESKKGKKKESEKEKK